jgi:phosphoribulokinase
MPRPIILGVVGDSATGKTTLSRGLVGMLGENNVTHVSCSATSRSCAPATRS